MELHIINIALDIKKKYKRLNTISYKKYKDIKFKREDTNSDL